jgi:uncharacterized protein (DUF2336 family)
MPETSSSLLVEIERAIASGTVRQRLKALKYVTDLFLAGSGRHSEDQLAMFDDVLLRLAALIEDEARSRLAQRFATLGAAPPRMIRLLAFDDAIEVAGPVLTQSECLTEPDLVENASIKSQAHLYAISRRRTLSEAVTDVLVDRGDQHVVRSVVKNVGARFSDQGFGKLVSRAGGDENLAESLGLRADIPRHHFLKLLQTASVAVRCKLAAADPRMAAAVTTAVAGAANSISERMRQASPAFRMAKRATKRRFITRQLNDVDVHKAAMGEKFDKAVAALALLGHVPVELVERALLDKSSDIVLILAKAANCSRATAKALLMMSVAERGMSAHDIDAALSSYDRLSVATARRVVRYYVKRYKDGAAAVELREVVSETIAAVA